MTNEPVMVIGAGGHAKVVLSTLMAAGKNVGWILDDEPERWGEELLGVEVLGPVSKATGLAERAVLAIGDNATRRELAETLRLDWLTAIHPRAWVHESVELGPGAVVFAGAVLQPGAVVGAHAIINTGAMVDHDCRIGDLAHLAPGVKLAGGVTIGEGAFLGVGCSVIPGVEVGEWAVVGAGAAVVRNLPAMVVAAGVPAAVLHQVE